MTTAERSRLEQWLHTDFHWTPRQCEVLHLIARGRTNAEIGRDLGISLDGAKWHVGEILSKLGAHSREEAAAYWQAYRSPKARLARAARALAPTTAWAKAAMGATALAAAGGAVAAVVLALQAGGDGGTHPGGATAPGATPTTEVQPTATAVSNGSTTGISLVDTVIAAVRNKDVASLEPLIDYTDVPCATNPQRLGAPPACPAGVPDGTPIPAITSGNCEGVSVPKSAMSQFLEQNIGNLGGVYSVSRENTGYVIIFVRTHWADGTAVSGPTVGQAWVLSDKGVTSLVSGCGDTAADLASRYPDFIVAPASQAASRPSPTIAGCTATDLACKKADDVVAALQSTDMESLFVNLQSGPVACPASGTVPSPGGNYPLCEGASEGELRNGFGIALHGSEGETVDETAFRQRVRDALTGAPGLRFLDIGCVTTNACEQFVLAFSTGGFPAAQPWVIYLTYDARRVPDMGPVARLTGMGISGDNAAQFFSGKGAFTGIGEVEFVHYTPNVP